VENIFRPFLAIILFLALTASGCNNAPDEAAAVSISGGGESVHKGAFVLLSAAVVGTPDKSVAWTIVETDKHSSTVIDSEGRLFVAHDETNAALTVQAALAANPNVSAATSVAIPAAAARVDMGWQPIYPLQGHADMLPGDYRFITAHKLVDPDPYETDIEWKWEIVGTVSDGTRLSNYSLGLFEDDIEVELPETMETSSVIIEISENEAMGNVFMLKATHPEYPNIFGYATVSVRHPSITKVILETEQENPAPGETVYVSVLLLGTGSIPLEDGNVLLSISGSTSPDTRISLYDRDWGGAELTLAEDETAAAITVTAISEKNPNVSGEITIYLEN